MKKCPSCHAFQDAKRGECPNCGHDLTNVEIYDNLAVRSNDIESHYPTISRRYLATFIDGIFILSVCIVLSYVFHQRTELASGLRVTLILAMVFIYEPILTSRYCTLGQKIMGVRIRRRLDYARISVSAAYSRIVVKALLGIISFFTIPLTKEKRAIHDFAAGSIVLRANPELID